MRRSWALVGGGWWHAFFTLLVAALITGVVNSVITLPYSALVGVLLYLDLRARKEALDLDTLKADLQASAA